MTTPREEIAAIFNPLKFTLERVIVEAMIETQLASALIDDAWADQITALENV